MYKKTTCSVGLAVLTGLTLSVTGFASDPAEDQLHPVAKLREMEQKASEHDFAVKKSDVLQQDVNQLRLALAAAQSQLNQIKNRYNPGRLLDLERKALAYSYLKDKVDEQDKKIGEVERQLAEEKCLTTMQAQDMDLLKQENAKMKGKENEHKTQLTRLRDTIDQLRMGNYEFYEVKEGDTLSTIAAMPMIYGDIAKAELIRQANNRRVENTENLKPGEVLIIPRFKPTGKYEF